MTEDRKSRLEALIDQGERLQVRVEESEEEPGATLRHRIDPSQFNGWSLLCTQYLLDVLPEDSPRRFLLEKIAELEAGPEATAYLLEQLRALQRTD